MMRVQRGRLVMALAAAAVLALTMWAFRPQPVPADFATVQRGAMRVAVDEEGITRVRERYIVSAPVAGRLQRVILKAGDPVVASQTVLASFLPATPTPLDPRARLETEARLKAAQAAQQQAGVSLAHARDELAYSRSEVTRYREISKFGGVTEERLAALEQDVRTREAGVKEAELSVQSTRHEMEALRAALRQFTSAEPSSALTLRSPISGVVLRIHQQSEALLAAGTPLIEVGDPRELEIVSDLLSTDAVKVKRGFAVLVDGWGGSTTLHGRVRLVEPGGFTKVSALGVEEQRVNVIIDLDEKTHDIRRLGDGYRVEISIVIWEHESVVKVPTSALFRRGNVWCVYVVADGRAHQRDVEIGQRNAVEAEVLSGLDAGMDVIVHPGDTIADEVPVSRRGS